VRIIRPFTITASTLAESDVPHVPPAAYNGGTTYGDGALVSELQADSFTYRVYESLQDGNTGHALTDADWWLFRADTYAEWDVGETYGIAYIVLDPASDHVFESLQAGNTGHSLSDPAWWLDLGPANRFKMFDQSNTSQTVNGEEIDVTVQVTGVANSVSFLNIVGATIRLIVSTEADGVIYDETVNLISSGEVSDWWEYFFLPVTRYGDWTFNDLPTNLNPTIRAILTDPGATAKIGSMVVGLSRGIGQVIHPSSVGIQDYSRKEADEFGYYTIIERGFAKRATLKVWVDERRIDAITTILAEVRAQPIVIVGVEQYRSTWIYGFIKDWRWNLAGPNESYLDIEVEGLT
jgi:hypothetical protein